MGDGGGRGGVESWELLRRGQTGWPRRVAPGDFEGGFWEFSRAFGGRRTAKDFAQGGRFTVGEGPASIRPESVDGEKVAGVQKIGHELPFLRRSHGVSFFANANFRASARDKCRAAPQLPTADRLAANPDERHGHVSNSRGEGERGDVARAMERWARADGERFE